MAETDVIKIFVRKCNSSSCKRHRMCRPRLARLGDASKWATSYRTDVLPNLVNLKEAIEKESDLARALSIRRTYIKANENLLDASYEASQAQADLALSTAEPAIAIGPGQTVDVRKFRTPE